MHRAASRFHIGGIGFQIEIQIREGVVLDVAPDFAQLFEFRQARNRIATALQEGALGLAQSLLQPGIAHGAGGVFLELRRGDLNHGGNPIAFEKQSSATGAFGQGGLRAAITFPNLPHAFWGGNHGRGFGMNIAALPARAAAAPGLARWGRDLTADVLFSVGNGAWILAIHKGVLTSANPAPPLMPSYDLAIRAGAEDFARFLQDPPPPGWHDIMGLVRLGTFKVEGNVALFMAHVFWFKGVLALLREPRA